MNSCLNDLGWTKGAHGLAKKRSKAVVVWL